MQNVSIENNETIVAVKRRVKTESITHLLGHYSPTLPPHCWYTSPHLPIHLVCGKFGVYFTLYESIKSNVRLIHRQIRYFFSHNTSILLDVWSASIECSSKASSKVKLLNDDTH